MLQANYDITDIKDYHLSYTVKLTKKRDDITNITEICNKVMREMFWI